MKAKKKAQVKLAKAKRRGPQKSKEKLQSKKGQTMALRIAK